MGNLKDKYCIVGIGESDLGQLSHLTTISADLIASKNALNDAGLNAKEVDGVIAMSPQGEDLSVLSLHLGELLGMTPLNFSADLNIGGATPVAMAYHAAMAMEAGLCRAVLCVSGRVRRAQENPSVEAEEDEFDAPYGMFGDTAYYAMAARRHMNRYNTTSRHLGLIAVAERAHALLNPIATMKEPMTIEVHQGSQLVVEPLRLLDCCSASDGAGAFIVVPRNRAKDLKHPPVYIMGIGESHPHCGILDSASLTTTGAKVSGEKALRMAGISLSDVDVAEIDDCVTYVVLVQLEDYGFCKKGEAGAFLESEGIEVNRAKIPVNTHGGLLSCANVPGVLHLTEAVKQVRGGCGERQVSDAEIALVSGNGGILSTHVSIILRK